MTWYHKGEICAKQSQHSNRNIYSMFGYMMYELDMRLYSQYPIELSGFQSSSVDRPKAGLVQVVQGNLLGSILSNLLLVLGMAIFASGSSWYTKANIHAQKFTCMFAVACCLGRVTPENCNDIQVGRMMVFICLGAGGRNPGGLATQKTELCNSDRFEASRVFGISCAPFGPPFLNRQKAIVFGCFQIFMDGLDL